MTFEYLGLSPEVMQAVTEAGYTQPTPIQRQAIPMVLQGRDVLGIAQTGTGKTASFTLPMIDILAHGRARTRMPRSLILEPTRELAAQVAESFETYGKYHKLTMALLIGGVSFSDQEKLLSRGVDVLIATPGRLLDQFERGNVLLNGVQILVIDEADRMLDMGFIPDVERICKMMPQKHQTLFFSATMAPEIKRITDQFLDDPKVVEVSAPASSPTTVTQGIIKVSLKDKRSALRALLRRETIQNAIIFCNRKRDIDVLYRSLKSHGFSAERLHGDMQQSTRMEVLAAFKNNEVQILVASDVAARGLDIPAVSHVFNFDVPSHAEDYVHRIGRTGRAGRSGAAFTLATPMDVKYVAAIEKMTGQKIPAAEIAFENTDQHGEEASAESKPSRESRPTRESGGRSAGSRRKSGKPAEAEPAAMPAEVAVAEAPIVSEVVKIETPLPREKPLPQETRAPQETPLPREVAKSRHEPREHRSRDQRSGNSNRDRHRRDDDHDEAIVGLGDHVPAFLLRSLPNS
jgi:superfamily II DNA/RNA helicase